MIALYACYEYIKHWWKCDIANLHLTNIENFKIIYYVINVLYCYVALLQKKCGYWNYKLMECCEYECVNKHESGIVRFISIIFYVDM